MLPSHSGQKSSPVPTRSSTLLEDKGRVCSHTLMNKKPSYMTLQPESQKTSQVLKVQVNVRPGHIEIVSLNDVLSPQVEGRHQGKYLLLFLL